MKIRPTAIPEVLLIEPRFHADERGFFLESWNRRDFAAAGLDLEFVQDNHSRSRGGILRGRGWGRGWAGLRAHGAWKSSAIGTRSLKDTKI